MIATEADVGFDEHSLPYRPAQRVAALIVSSSDSRKSKTACVEHQAGQHSPPRPVGRVTPTERMTKIQRQSELALHEFRSIGLS
jgi:hypothetical protein